MISQPPSQKIHCEKDHLFGISSNIRTKGKKNKPEVFFKAHCGQSEVPPLKMHLLLVYEVLIGGGLPCGDSQDGAAFTKFTPLISPRGELMGRIRQTETAQPWGGECHMAINALAKTAGLYEVSDLVGRYILPLLKWNPWRSYAPQRLSISLRSMNQQSEGWWIFRCCVFLYSSTGLLVIKGIPLSSEPTWSVCISFISVTSLTPLI